jgi:RNA polymerase sigma-70 factor (ECF subfamily)
MWSGMASVTETGDAAHTSRMSKQGHVFERSRARPSAFEEFYDEHAEAVLAFFARRTFDVEAARDLMAETFAQAYQHRRRFRGDSPEEAAGWLYGIARHQLSHYVRHGVARLKAVERLGIELRVIADDDYERVFELAGLQQMRQRVADAFDALEIDQQQALQLRVID